MQIHREDLVQLTLMWDSTDLRRSVKASCRSAFRANVRFGVIFAVMAGLIAFEAAERSSLELIYVGALCALFSVLNLVNPWLHVRNALRKAPDHRYAPNTYQIDTAGVHWEGPEGHLLVRWLAITNIEHSQHFWRFHVDDSTVMAIPRRTLTTDDDAAIAAILQRLRPTPAEALSTHAASATRADPAALG